MMELQKRHKDAVQLLCGCLLNWRALYAESLEKTKTLDAVEPLLGLECCDSHILLALTPLCLEHSQMHG